MGCSDFTRSTGRCVTTSVGRGQQGKSAADDVSTFICMQEEIGALTPKQMKAKMAILQQAVRR